MFQMQSHPYIGNLDDYCQICDTHKAIWGPCRHQLAEEIDQAMTKQLLATVKCACGRAVSIWSESHEADVGQRREQTGAGFSEPPEDRETYDPNTNTAPANRRLPRDGWAAAREIVDRFVVGPTTRDDARREINRMAEEYRACQR